MSSTVEAVIAGSRGFALSLLAPLTERIGSRPRIAADPEQAGAYCTEPGCLVIVEFLGEESLHAIEALLREGVQVRVVAAVREGHAVAEAPLRALGVELARWDGTPGDVVAAVGRQLERAPSAAQAPAPPPGAASPPARSSGVSAPAAAPRAAAAASPRPAPSAPARPPPPVIAPSAGLGAVPHRNGPSRAGGPDGTRGAPAVAPPRPWPSSVPGQVEAAEALQRAFLGTPSAGPALAGMAPVLASLSRIERDVLAGKPLPLDPRPIRAAAAMRVRVAAALATVPAQGGEVDAGAVSAFLAEIDALLSEVKALAPTAPAEALPSLEVVRNALVREAIDLSEAVQRAVPPGQAAPQRPPPASKVRLLPGSKADGPRPAVRRHLLHAVFALAVAGAAAFHGYAVLRRSRLAEPPGRAGAPANAVIVSGPGAGDSAVIRSKDGRPFAPDEVKRLTETEALKGNAVIETGPGLLVIVPSRHGSPAPPRAPPAR